MTSLLDTFPHKCKIQIRSRTYDALGGGSDSVTVEQSDVECWEQPASVREVKDFEKRGMIVDRKIYFKTKPNVTEQHEIIITERNGSTIASADQITLDVAERPLPDASAGLGVVYKVMANQNTGAEE